MGILFMYAPYVLENGGIFGDSTETAANFQARPPNRILRDTVNERAVRILLECILVFF